MVQATDEFVKNDHKAAPYHASALQGHARALFDELHVCPSEQGERPPSSFALLLERKINQTKVNSFSILCLFISAMRPLDFDAKMRSKR